MDKDEALKQALRLCEEALPKFNWGASFLDANAIQLLNTVPAAIKEALAQPAQEPYAWAHTKIEGIIVFHRPAGLDRHPDRWEALYKAPQQRPWVGLTDEEIKAMDAGGTSNSSFYAGAFWAEAKLKEKNNET